MINFISKIETRRKFAKSIFHYRNERIFVSFFSFFLLSLNASSVPYTTYRMGHTWIYPPNVARFSFQSCLKGHHKFSRSMQFLIFYIPPNAPSRTISLYVLWGFGFFLQWKTFFFFFSLYKLSPPFDTAPSLPVHTLGGVFPVFFGVFYPAIQQTAAKKSLVAGFFSSQWKIQLCMYIQRR